MFFLKTPGQCTDVATQKLVDRYLYINNVPDGSIPLLTGGTMAAHFSTFRGLIPGIVSSIGALNPLTIFKGFMEGSNPPCKEVSDSQLPTKGPKNTAPYGTPPSGGYHVSLTDLKELDPCFFNPKGTNPYSGKTAECFTLMNLSKKKLSHLYILTFGLLLLYIANKLLRKQ